MNLDENIKFIIIIYNGYVKYNNNYYHLVLDKFCFSSIKETRKTMKKIEKLYPKTLFLNREIVLKEKNKNRWIEIEKK